jgi:sugar phosphate isomerase/epimerase
MQTHIALAFILGPLALTLGCATFNESTGRARPPIAKRAACSSLCQCKQPTDVALKVIADMGYRWVDLSALSWAPHISMPDLMKDFDKEAERIEGLLATCKLRVSNLTFDAIETKPFDEYEEQWRALVRLAARLDARLINIMAPSAKCDRADQIEKLRVLQKIASESNVGFTIETHCNQITELPADAKWACEQVPGMGLTLDPSHYYAGPNQGKPFDELYPLTMGTGFRAGGMSWKTIQSPWGTGPIDFDEIVRKLEAGGYDGFYVAEYIEGFNDLSALEQSKRFLEWARQYKD